MDYDFTGRYDHQLDSKRRIRIPSKFRNQIEGAYSLCVGPDGCVWVLPPETRATIIENFKKKHASERDARAAKRRFNASMYTPDEDPQGRIVLPKELATYAGIDKEVVFVGMGNYVELWSAENFYKYNNEIEVDIGLYLDPDLNED